MALEAVCMVYSNVLRDHVNKVSKIVTCLFNEVFAEINECSKKLFVYKLLRTISFLSLTANNWILIIINDSSKTPLAQMICLRLMRQDLTAIFGTKVTCNF